MLRAEVLSGMDMTTEAAVTKLMWALAQEDTDRWLSENLCGEVRTGGRYHRRVPFSPNFHTTIKSWLHTPAMLLHGIEQSNGRQGQST